MKITFIGTSHGVPESDRKCTCIMIEIKERFYFVDMGTIAIDALRARGISIDAVKGIFITHMHGDHTNGLPQFIDLITWYFKTADPVVCLPDMNAAKVLNDWLKVCQTMGQKEIHYHEVQSGTIYDDGVLKVTAIPTKHCKNSYSYLLEAEGKTVLFSSDLKHPTVDFPSIVPDKFLDLLICEAAHFPAIDYLPILDKYNIKKICITHYTPENFASIFQLQQKLAIKKLSVLIASDDLEMIV